MVLPIKQQQCGLVLIIVVVVTNNNNNNVVLYNNNNVVLLHPDCTPSLASGVSQGYMAVHTNLYGPGKYVS